MRRRKRETLINFPTDDVKCTKNYFWKGERGSAGGPGGKIIEVQDLTLIHSTPTADFWFRWHLACMIDVMFFLTRSDRELISNFPLPQGINKLFIMRRPKWRISRVSEIPWISRWSFSSRPTYFLFHEHTRISWSFAAIFCFFWFSSTLSNHLHSWCLLKRTTLPRLDILHLEMAVLQEILLNFSTSLGTRQTEWL